jgi:hypothetical protein
MLVRSAPTTFHTLRRRCGRLYLRPVILAQSHPCPALLRFTCGSSAWGVLSLGSNFHNVRQLTQLTYVMNLNTKVDNFWVWASKLFAKLFYIGPLVTLGWDWKICHEKFTTTNLPTNRSGLGEMDGKVWYVKLQQQQFGMKHIFPI